MKQTRILMDMPITVEIVDATATEETINKIYDYFHYIDETFSTFKETSEITKINKNLIRQDEWSEDMRTIFKLAEQTKKETNEYFDIRRNNKYDPSGIVKGWAIQKASELLQKEGFHNYFVEAGGDIQVSGKNKKGKHWTVGIRNPFNRNEIVKVLTIHNEGVATSGTYIRGNHIYNPKENKIINDIVSLTVIGPNVYEADRFATAAFAMGEKGIHFIENRKGFEAYMINIKGIATFTSGFEKYTI